MRVSIFLSAVFCSSILFTSSLSGSVLADKKLNYNTNDIPQVKCSQENNCANFVERWAEITILSIPITYNYMSPAADARMLFMIQRAMFDAIAPYTKDHGPLLPAFDDYYPHDRRPESEHNDAYRSVAASYAAYKVITDIYKDLPENLKFINNFFLGLGLEPNATSSDPNHPISIGNYVGQGVIKFHSHDGFNSEGDMPGTKLTVNGTKAARFTDWTNYHPINIPQTVPTRTNCSELRDINHWQPLTVKVGDKVKTQTYASPWAICTKPFALTVPSQFRPDPPYLYGTTTQGQFINQLWELVNISGNLTDTQKVQAEFFADGPDGATPPGHWLRIAKNEGLERGLDLIRMNELCTVVTAALYDAGIASWDTKRTYDSVRPISAIQCVLGGIKARVWGGPHRGTVVKDLAEWMPYQDPKTVTPAFAEYVSGHSTFSFAAAEALKRYFGDDAVNKSYTIYKGTSIFEGKIDNSSDPRFIDGVTNVPNSGPGTPGYSPATDITLKWSSFTEIAEGAGISRRFGGIHFKLGDLKGRELGSKVGEAVWQKFRTHIPSYTPPLSSNEGTNQANDNKTEDQPGKIDSKRTILNNRLRRLLSQKFQQKLNY